MLNERRDDLVEEAKLAEKLNEDLKQQSKAQDEISEKQLKNKLNREPKEEIRDMLASE